MEKTDIKIFVSHRIDLESETIDNPLYVNVRCGAVFDNRNQDKLNGMIGDDTGVNISAKRMSFCELTVMYWAWKNENADYYGLCHYRRYLNLSNTRLPESKTFRFVYLDSPSKAVLDKAGFFREDEIRKNIEKNDIIVSHDYNVRKEGISDPESKSVKQNWIKNCSSYLREESFDLLLKIIDKRAPEYSYDAREYMNGMRFRGFNCFVMKKVLFFELCEFMFPILFEFDDRLDKLNFSETMNRAAAYAGEWLYSIWIYHQQKKKMYKIKECQLVVFLDTSIVKRLTPINDALPVVAVADEGNRPLLAVTIQSVLENVSKDKKLDIIILQKSGTDDRWKELLRKSENEALVSMVSEYDNATIRFYDPKNDLGVLKYHEYGKLFVEEIFYLTLLPWILKEYEKVICINEALLLKNDISKIMSEVTEEKLAYGTANVFFEAAINGHIKGIKHFYKQKYPEIDPYNFMSTNILFMNLELCRKQLSKAEVIDSIIKNQYKSVESCWNGVYNKNIGYVSMKWNATIASEPDYYKLIEYIPARYNQNERDAYAINLQTLAGISRVVSLNSTRLFWKYAKKTPFYEQLIQQSIPGYGQQIFGIPLPSKMPDFRSKEQVWADELFPLMSRKRRIADALLPKKSFGRKFLKSLVRCRLSKTT